MKIIIITIFVLLFVYNDGNAQSVVISDVASYTPETSAMLDVNSNSRGLLVPRMSTVERDTIVMPAEGLIIFNTSNNTIEIFNGSSWGSATAKFICGTSQITDTSGNLYNTVKIGGQCWMAENLNTGIMIAGSVNQNNNSILEKYCYNDSEDSCNFYGGLYQWDELMQYTLANGVQGICMDGWHIPTDAEWCTLERELDLTLNCDSTDWRGTDAGTKLKQSGSSGFNGLLTGYRKTDNSFDDFAMGAWYWTSSVGSAGAWNRKLSNNEIKSARNDFGKNYGLSVRCIKDVKKSPTLTTDSAINITKNSANVPGEIIDLGRGEIIQYGHCWSTSTNPVLNNDLFNAGSTDTTNTFTSQLTNLSPATTYYVRAYAQNEYGLAYSKEIVFLSGGAGGPCPGIPTIIYGGQVYNTIQFGNQCWLKENLNIGTMINGSLDQSNNATIEKYCYYDDPNYCNTYGGLYQWNELMQYLTTEGVQGICPSGWHIPTDAEWCILEQEIDTNVVCANTGWRGLDVGYKMKTGGSSGFDAVMGGYRTTSGTYFSSYTSNGLFWTSTENDGSTAYYRQFNIDTHTVYRYYYSKQEGRSVRCLKDE